MHNLEISIVTKIIRIIVLVLAMVFIITSGFNYSFAVYTSSITTLPSGVSAVVPAPNPIVLNEVMYHPVTEGGTMPNGEWIELYNNSSSPIDVAGWQIKDSTSFVSHIITISSSNSDNNLDTSDSGETIVPAGGWLVVYKNGASIFNNSGGDTVRLYNGSTLVDSVTYTESKAAGFTFARIPDGFGAWVDPIPTPGEPNKLGEVLSAMQSPIIDNVEPTTEPSPTPTGEQTTAPTLEPVPTETPIPSPTVSPEPVPLEIPSPPPASETPAPTPAPGSPPTTEPEPTETPAPIETPQT